MICFVIYGVNTYVSKHKLNSFEKMYDILMNLVDYSGNFPRFWLIFCYPDPQYCFLPTKYFYRAIGTKNAGQLQLILIIIIIATWLFR